MTIILVRHGETALNVARVLQPAATPLSANGVAQAAAVAQRLAGIGVAAILSSDLPRALVTAQAIGADCGLSVSTTSLLHERNFGNLRGQPYDDLGYDVIAAESAAPGGESMADFEARVALAFDLIVHTRQALSAPLVVVTHGLVIRALLLRHCGVGADMPAHLGNTAVSVVAAQAPHRFELLACTAHLDRRDADAASALSGG